MVARQLTDLRKNARKVLVAYVMATTFLAMLAIAAFWILSQASSVTHHNLQLRSHTSEISKYSARLADRIKYLRQNLDQYQQHELLLENIKADIKADVTELKSHTEALQALASKSPSVIFPIAVIDPYLYGKDHKLIDRIEIYCERIQSLLSIPNAILAEDLLFQWAPADTAFGASGIMTYSFDALLNEIDQKLTLTQRQTKDIHFSLIGIALVTLLLEALLIFTPLLRRLKQQIGQTEQAKDELVQLALHDQVTGLPNASNFETQCLSVLKSSPGYRYNCLALIRIKNLDTVFDHYGMKGVQNLWKMIANKIELFAKSEQPKAKLTDRHFSLLLSSTTSDSYIHNRAKELLDYLNEAIDTSDGILNQEIQIALVDISAENFNLDSILADADLAISEQGNTLKPSPIIYEPAIRTRYEERKQKTEEIIHALDEKQFCSWYQPKWTMDGKTVTGFEALIRWQHPQRGILPPSVFLEYIEHSSREMLKLTLAVIEQAVKDYAIWMSHDLQAKPIAINMPNFIFQDNHLFHQILQAIRTANQRHHIIDVEITETVPFQLSLDKVSELVEQFHDAGAKVALDDFGTGFASLSSLLEVDCDEIKIDKQFIQTCTTDDKSRAIIESVSHFSERVSVITTAEGVEEQEQLDFLSDLNCKQVQGYLFSKPVSAEEAEEFLKPLGNTHIFPLRKPYSS